MNIFIAQSNYIPWKGYFDNIAQADIFVIYDTMQYTRQDWRNRNLIKTNAGLKWVTIPVESKGCLLKKINDTYIINNDWKIKHLAQLKENYAKAAFYKETIEFIESIYMTAEGLNLSSINTHFLKKICGYLNIKTQFINSTELESKGNPTERLVEICTILGCNKYITGPLAKNYINGNLFMEKGIVIEFVDYSGYEKYPQLYPPFEHGVSILDLIFNCGEDAKNYLKYVGKAVQISF